MPLKISTICICCYFCSVSDEKQGATPQNSLFSLVGTDDE
jgi:hypothetical protein